MIFSLARDSSWEKGSATPQRPNLRRIPLHGIFSEDRVGNSAYLKNKKKQQNKKGLMLSLSLFDLSLYCFLRDQIGRNAVDSGF